MTIELQQTKDWHSSRLSHPRCAGTKLPESLEAVAFAAAPEIAGGQLARIKAMIIRKLLLVVGSIYALVSVGVWTTSLLWRASGAMTRRTSAIGRAPRRWPKQPINSQGSNPRSAQFHIS